MKIKHFLLTLFSSILFFSCSSPSMDLNFDSWGGLGSFQISYSGVIYISDDCDCLQIENIAICSDPYWLNEDEHKRILEIINKSTEPCIYIQGVDMNDETFEGYIILFTPDE